MYTVTVTRGTGALVDHFQVRTFDEVCAYARTYWMASKSNIITWRYQ